MEGAPNRDEAAKRRRENSRAIGRRVARPARNPRVRASRGRSAAGHAAAGPALPYRIDSFAEAFRTQKNRKGEIVVLGEGAGSAIESNVKLTDLQPVVQSTYDALIKSAKK